MSDEKQPEPLPDGVTATEKPSAQTVRPVGLASTLKIQQSTEKKD